MLNLARITAFICWIKLKLSRGEICVANIISLANGASLGSYFFKTAIDYIFAESKQISPV